MAGMSKAVRRSYWTDIIRQCNQSGMVKNDWMRQHNISEKSFYYWQKKLRDEAAVMLMEDESVSQLNTIENRFVELSASQVVSTEHPCPVTLHKGDLLIELKESISDEFLRRILEVMNHA